MNEEATYDNITHTRLGIAINPIQVDKTPKHTASASAGCEADLPRLDQELLNSPMSMFSVSTNDTSQIDAMTKQLEVLVEPISTNQLKSQLSPKPSTSGNKPGCEQDLMNLSDVKICIDKLMMDNPSQQIIVTCKLLEDLPKSKYREEGYLSTLTATYKAPKIDIDRYDTDATVAYSSLDETIPYWPLEDDQQICVLPRSTSPDKIQKGNPPKKRITMAKPSTVSKFNINVHGIRRCWHRYYFKCVVKKCGRIFDKIKYWNTHHRIIHKSKIKCAECGQKFITPSSHHAHKNNHAPCKHTCQSCKKTFPYVSGLNQHKIVHTHSKLHCCFSGSCKKAYEWPQDLTCHVQCHVQKKLPCNKCHKTFLEERLLKCHAYKHLDIYRYHCKLCEFKCKWLTPFR